VVNANDKSSSLDQAIYRSTNDHRFKKEEDLADPIFDLHYDVEEYDMQELTMGKTMLTKDNSVKWIDNEANNPSLNSFLKLLVFRKRLCIFPSLMHFFDFPL